MNESKFTHLGAEGHAQMVDVGAKTATARVAIAKSLVTMSSEVAEAIRHSEIAKGDVLNVARIAGIQAAKMTANLIPLCHTLPLDQIQLTANWIGPCGLEWTAEARVTGKTGVEMEAMLAASIAALTVYDMCKAIDRSMEISSVRLCSRDGGKSGRYLRDQD